MRILWVKAGKLLPVNSGGRIRTYHILRQLDRRHEVTVLSYYGGSRDEAYESEVRSHFPGAVTIYTAARDEGPLDRSVDYLRKLSCRAPYAVAKFTAPEVQHRLASWIGERRFDVVVCDFLSASLNFPQDLATPTVLFQHNVESVLWRRQAQVESNWPKKLVFKIEAAKMLRYEREAVRRFHHIIAVSNRDRDVMTSMTDPSRISVIPTGVDIERFRAVASDTALKRALVLFTGDMNFEPNIDGVSYFCREIWPKVLNRAPEARFRIVGRNPHRQVRKLSSDSVEVTGTVPSVIEHMQEAQVFVVPLRMGGGTRLKVYEAMAMGKAVVSTAVGAEGLEVHDGHDILLADHPARFADAVAAFLSDPELRRRYGVAAAELAARYDWSVIAERFADVLAQVVPAAGSADR